MFGLVFMVIFVSENLNFSQQKLSRPKFVKKNLDFEIAVESTISYLEGPGKFLWVTNIMDKNPMVIKKAVSWKRHLGGLESFTPPERPLWVESWKINKLNRFVNDFDQICWAEILDFVQKSYWLHYHPAVTCSLFTALWGEM